MSLLCLAPNPSIDRLLEVEVLTPGAIHRPVAVRAVAGGKGLNVARTAAALGVSVRVAGILGGHAGRWIVDELQRSRVEGSFAWMPAETRTCLSVLDQKSGLLTEFYEPGPPAAGEAWPEFVALSETELLRRPMLVTISGSLPPKAPTDGIAKLCAVAHSAGVLTIVDTYGDALREALLTTPWLVKVNVAEAVSLTGTRGADERAATVSARVLAAASGMGAIVTCGARGAVVVTRTGAWRMTPPSVGGPYTVGSGDAFLGGLAAGIVRGDSLEDAIRLAGATGAANSLSPGAGELETACLPDLVRAVTLTPLETR